MKKRIVLVLILMLLGVLIYGCMGHVKPGARTIMSTGDYQERDIRSAMAVVERRFHLFPGCTMTMLYYDGDSAKAAQAEWAEASGAEEAIVLGSCFRTGPIGDPSMESDAIYEWSWILVRNPGGVWKLYTYGYG